MNKQATTNLDYWKYPLIYTALSTIAVLLIFNETLVSMVSIWWRTGTYAHGFFILPISFYLIWQKRTEVLKLIPRPGYKPILILFVIGGGWLLARIVDALVIQQFLLVSMIPVIVWTQLGWKVLKASSFALFFLFFMIPAGDILIPTLMNFTADFTVDMVRLVGIPIYREGLFFSLPSGNWSVVEACSGIRYLIASLTLGVLYAYLTYTNHWKRFFFIVLAIIFPIIANGLRAFMIVMIGHFSDMTLAVGVDHLIYGWLFFGIVMIVMFWIGSFWRDEPLSDSTTTNELTIREKLAPNSTGVIHLVLIVLVCGIWSFKVSSILSSDALEAERQVVLNTPENSALWQRSEDHLTDWKPRYIGYSKSDKTTYRSKDAKVELFLTYYAIQKQGEELVGWHNVLAPGGQQISKEISRKTKEEDFNGNKFQLVESRLKLLKSDRRFIAWRWNWVSGEHTANDFKTKILGLKAKLLGRKGEAGIVILSEYDESNQKNSIMEAQAALKSFVKDMLPKIEKSLEKATQLP